MTQEAKQNEANAVMEIESCRNALTNFETSYTEAIGLLRVSLSLCMIFTKHFCKYYIEPFLTIEFLYHGFCLHKVNLSLTGEQLCSLTMWDKIVNRLRHLYLPSSYKLNKNGTTVLVSYPITKYCKITFSIHCDQLSLPPIMYYWGCMWEGWNYITHIQLDFWPY